MEDGSREALAVLRLLAERAVRRGTAGVRLGGVVAALGDEPLYEYVGSVDFRTRSYDGGRQRVVDGVLYGLRDDGVWTRGELGSRTVISPLWILELLAGATTVTRVEAGQEAQAAV